MMLIVSFPKELAMGQPDPLPNGSLFLSPAPVIGSARAASHGAGSGETPFTRTASRPSDRLVRNLAVWETSWIDLGGEG